MDATPPTGEEPYFTPDGVPYAVLLESLDHLRAALVVRADTAKRFADALRGKTSTELTHNQYLRARMLRVAYYEAIKLIDELRERGDVENWQSGGTDPLVGDTLTGP